MMMGNDRYTYWATRYAEDEEHVGLCAEFPSLSWPAPAPEGALAGIRQLVAEVIADPERNSEPVPEPFAARQYTGKFVVRIPPDVHQRLAIEAAEVGVSLSRFVSAKLSH